MLKVFMRYALSVLLLISTTPAFSQIISPLSAEGNNLMGREYFAGVRLGKPLLTINLISGVTNPGVYHVPVDTDLAQLFSYAGGVKDGFDLENIIIRNASVEGKPTVKSLDFDKGFSVKSDLYRLTDKDTIYIKEKDGLEKASAWLTIASTAISILLAITVIENSSNN